MTYDHSYPLSTVILVSGVIVPINPDEIPPRLALAVVPRYSSLWTFSVDAASRFSPPLVEPAEEPGGVSIASVARAIPATAAASSSSPEAPCSRSLIQTSYKSSSSVPVSMVPASGLI